MEVRSAEDLAKQVGADWPFILKGRENSRIEFDRIKGSMQGLSDA